MSPWREALRETWSRPEGRIGLVVLGVVVVLAVALPPLLQDPRAQPDILSGALRPPSRAHWLGTDHLSRDVLSRVVYGGRISLAVAAGAVALSVTLGAFIGLVAGYAGGWLDAIAMRVVDGALAIPRLFLLLLIAAVMDHIPLLVLILAIGATGWFGTSRLVRAEVLRLRQLEFVRSAEALGAGQRRVIFRHLLPNVVGPLAVATTLAVGDVVLLEAGLSFLGLGVQPPTPSWGGMILDAKSDIIAAPWTSLAPGVAIVLTVLAVNLVGEALRDAFDPPTLMTTLLRIEELKVSFHTAGGHSQPVDGVNLTVDRGETVALVGESGCGKSLTSLSILRLVPPPGRIDPGSRITLGETDVMALEGEALRHIRGRRIGMVFQDPMTSLNPVFTVGDQIAEGILAHFPVSKKEAMQRAEALMVEVGIPDPRQRLKSYPHQMSGGMRQRVMIAIALSAEPELLIADEPTTALDVTVQAQILEVLDRLQSARGMAVLLITHDLGIVAGRADRVAVMYAGRIVEQARTVDLFAHPSHPYTRGLLASMPRLGGPRKPLTPIKGMVPSPTAWPQGCRFHPRCPDVMGVCTTEPPIVEVGQEHWMRCWLGVEKDQR